MIRRCAELHLAHIAHGGDPFEFGSARPLDFGHWAAHKLEAMTGYRLRHGEAVAIGMALDAGYSSEIGLLEREQAASICALLEALGFSLWDAVLDHDEGRKSLLDGLAEFREHLGGELTLTMLSNIGCGIEVRSIELPALRIALEKLSRRNQQ
jgi:3-dehydroquinate synthase